jgi:hypothetical protein
MDLPRLSRIVYLADDASLYLIAGGQGMRLSSEAAGPWLKQGVFVVTREDLGPQGYGIELLDEVGSLSRIKHLPGRHDQKSHGRWAAQRPGVASTHGTEQEVGVVSTHSDVASALSAKNSSSNAADLRVVKKGKQVQVISGRSQEEVDALREKVKSTKAAHPEDPRSPKEREEQKKALLRHLNSGVPARSFLELDVSWEGTKQVEQQLAKELARETGMLEKETLRALEAWTSSSNDTQLPSLTMQSDAAKVFNVPLSSWQKTQLQKTLQAREQALSRNRSISPWGPLSFPFSSSWDVSSPQRTPESVEKSEKLLKTMYKRTQEQLKAAGITHIEVYRGVGKGPELPSRKTGARVTRRGNVLESWTVSRSVAEYFGPVIVRTVVPVERVLSTCRTGFGSLPEHEVVVIGGVDDVVEIIRTSG